MSLGRVVVDRRRRRAARRRGPAPRVPRLLTVRRERPTGLGREEHLDRFVFLTVDGLSQGAVFAAFALALVLIWRAARIVNFAQGAMAVAAGVRRATRVTQRTGSLLAGLRRGAGGRPGARRAGGAGGDAVRRRTARRSTRSSSRSGWCCSSRRSWACIYGNEFLPAVAARSAATRHRRSAGCRCCRRYDLFVFAAVVAHGGRRWRCCSPGPRSACGCGRRRSPPRCPGCSASTWPGCSRSAGRWPRRSARWPRMLVMPTELGLHPNAMDLVFVSAFTAAVVGGLDSPPGAVVGGLAVGLILSYVSGYSAATSRRWPCWCCCWWCCWSGPAGCSPASRRGRYEHD